MGILESKLEGDFSAVRIAHDVSLFHIQMVQQRQDKFHLEVLLIGSICPVRPALIEEIHKYQAILGRPGLHICFPASDGHHDAIEDEQGLSSPVLLIVDLLSIKV